MDKIFGITDPFLSLVADRLNLMIDMFNSGDEVTFDTYMEELKHLTTLVTAAPMMAGCLSNPETYSEIGQITPFIRDITIAFRKLGDTFSQADHDAYREKEIFDKLESYGIDRAKAEKLISNILQRGDTIKLHKADKSVKGAWGLIEEFEA